MILHKSAPSALLLTTLITTACVVGPDYNGPADRGAITDAIADATRMTGDRAVDQPVVPHFWTSFDDPQLNALVTRALAENRDLVQAEARVRMARAAAGESGLDRFPAATVEAGHTEAKQAAVLSGGSPQSADYHDASLNALWELDFFGRVRRQHQASQALAEAAGADRDSTALLVAAETTRAYLALTGTQAQLDVAWQNTDNLAQTLELTESVLQAGRGTRGDVSNARAQLAATRALIPALEAAKQRAIHRLGVLTVQSSDTLSDALVSTVSLPAVPDTIAVGAPRALLRRRPDVRAAERRLAASTAQVGVATADLFPRVNLLGSLGWAATSVSGFGHSDAEYYSVGPRLTWSAFDFGRVRARLRQAQAGSDVALAVYEQTVLLALEDTQNALADYGQARARTAALDEAVTSAVEASDLARERYEGGIASFLEVLDAERREIEIRTNLAAARTQTLSALVRVYMALAGGVESSVQVAVSD
mgnify:FL=1|jgi:multidrug efflux system outer membrane protein